jgi:long-subunit acyl-CoA synthetase (AMP-forming)
VFVVSAFWNGADSMVLLLCAVSFPDEVNEIVGPQALTNGIVGSRERLKEIETALNQDKKVRRAVLEDVSRVQGRSSQDGERIGEAYLVLEPFNMINGFLTQTLKVKRNQVADHYAKEIASLYSK